MSSYRRNWYDGFKDRRYGFIFLGIFFVVVVFWIAARKMDIDPRFFLVGAGVLGGGWISGFVRRCRSNRRVRWRYEPLSCDEIHKARSKLGRCHNWKR